MKLLVSIIILVIFAPGIHPSKEDVQGAWKSDSGVLVIANGYFSYCKFDKSSFHFTYGGSVTIEKDQIIFGYEFHTKDSTKVGTSETIALKLKSGELSIGDLTFERLDDGTPGKLFGAWLFTNRERDGSMGTPRSADEPRKTLKILSGTRFQWIAYNVDTKQFMGTGGGTYTTENGKYTENIDFFSRDQSRVGASLEFNFEIVGSEWHHKGKSSKGDPMYEIWTMRE